MMENNMNNRCGCQKPLKTECAREELLNAVCEADFFAQDLKLYLDTHPDDRRAVEMYRDAVKQYKACKSAFEETFYPLCCESAAANGEWDWLCGNFPPQS